MNNNLKIDWQWPIDISKYDTEIILNENDWARLEELKSLAFLGCAGKKLFHPENSSWAEEAIFRFETLLIPVKDVLIYILRKSPLKHNHDISKGVIYLLITTMLNHRTTYWKFPTEVWSQLLGPDHYKYIRNKEITRNVRYQTTAVAYLLCKFECSLSLQLAPWKTLAEKIFGEILINPNVDIVLQILQKWGYTPKGNISTVHSALTKLMLTQRSPSLADINIKQLQNLYNCTKDKSARRGLILISYALVDLDIISTALADKSVLANKMGHRKALDNVTPEWQAMCQRWFDTTTQQPSSKTSTLYRLLLVGRWFAHKHPNLKDLSDWNREICAELIAAVNCMTVGQWVSTVSRIKADYGKPLTANSKERILSSLRAFCSDLQDWGVIERKFNPARALASPRSIRALITTDPRVIDDAIWAKIMWAGMNLTNKDLLRVPANTNYKDGWKFYPPAMIKAVAIVWIFCGLRRNEISRLRLGCIRWQENYEDNTKGPTCMLDIPVNKTGRAFTKPIDSIVGKFINSWENERPPQPVYLDKKTGEKVQILFSIRGKPIGSTYLNNILIPLLCEKANVPLTDVRGRITSHRARATIASQLYNAKTPLTLFELQDWLGHSSPESTRHYTKISPTILAKSYANAGYFSRNIRSIEVLIDREVIESYKAGEEPWKHYDLGHGYCNYDFFEQCPHRMACARCDFYTPKNSIKSQLLEGKKNLLRLRQEIPLTDIEIEAIDGDVSAYEKLLNQLTDEPTPADIKINKIFQKE